MHVLRRDPSVPGMRLSPLARGVILAVAGAPAGFSTAALGQVLEEVIVTAERREMSLQDTPISVISFTGESLELRGVDDMMELATIAPNLDVKGSRGTGDTSPIWQIRGISGGGGATGERGVGFYIDNVFMPRTTGPVMRVLDVERVEVLRGPQGTLFGRNSTGGAIRVFSKQPGPESDAYIRLTGGSMGRRDLSAMVNVPLSDQTFFRAQGALLQQDGYVERGPQDLGSADDKFARLQLALNPSDRVEVALNLLYTESESDGSPTEMTAFKMDPVCPFDPNNPYICWQGNYADWVSDFLETAGQERLRDNDPRLVRDDYSMPSFCFLDGPDPDWDDACRQWNNSDYTQFDAAITWDISDRVAMISTTGMSDFGSEGVSDWQLLGMEFRPSTVESEVIYQEFQFNIDIADGRVELITGFNYFYEDSASPREALYNAVGSSTFNGITGGSANGNEWGCNTGLGIPCAGTERRLRVTGDSSTRQESNAYGLFASAMIHLTDRFNLTLGVRESYDEKKFSNTLFAADNFIPQDGISTTVSAKDDWSATDWRATFDVNVTDDIMVYVTGSKAFRSGTFTAPGPSCATPTVAGQCTSYHVRPQAGAVPPEEVLNRELGFRTEWFNGRFRFNATYYEMDFTNRQGASAVPDATSPTGFAIQLVNQGDVDLWGTEIEAMFAVTDRFTIDGSTGRANFKMADVCINNGPYLFPPPMDRSYNLGARYDMPEMSKGSFTLGINFSHTGPMQTHPGGFTAEENAIYGCSAFSTTFIDSRYEVPSFDLVNATLRFTSSEGQWSATLYGNNLTDEVYANNAQSFGRGYWTAGGPPGAVGIGAPPRSAIADYRGRPREYGLTFQYNFR